MLRKVMKGIGLLLIAAALLIGINIWRNWDVIQRVFLGGVKIYETNPPLLPARLPRPAILVFSKANAYRHDEAITAASKLFEDLAKQNGWGIYQTENGATFTPAILDRFDAVVFSNVSGDVLTTSQRAAFQDFIESGGGFVGIHAAGDSSHQAWPWYVTSIIGAHFVGHPMAPQIQRATINIDDKSHSANRGLPAKFESADEWYSFEKSPRGIPGLSVLATLDENTYEPGSFFGTPLSMGKDHPISWWRCVGKGRVLYTALGHTAASFDNGIYRLFLNNALNWTVRRAGNDCDAASAEDFLANGSMR